jgi:hypothetical protein
MFRNIALFVLVAVLAAACSGNPATPTGGTVASPELASASDWNPLAPAIEVPPLERAVAAAPQVAAGAFRLTMLGRANRVDAAGLAALGVAPDTDGFSVSLDSPRRELPLYISYDPDKWRFATAEFHSEDALTLAQVVRPGLLAVGMAATGGDSLAPGTELATVRFCPGPEADVRRVSIADTPANAVTDLEAAVDEETGAVTLSWSERHIGDYNLDGLVSLADITPIAQNFNQTVDPDAANYGRVEVVDGNADGLISLADMTPIAQSFGSAIGGYDVYATPLSTPDEMPVPADDPGRWSKVDNDADPDGPSAPREYSGQTARLSYTFNYTPEAGDYGWYVEPVGNSNDPRTGPPSNVATATTAVTGGVALEFELMPPATELLNVDDEFYLGIKVLEVEGLFSANVRFEYDATLVEPLEFVASYTGDDSTEHPNLLEPPLFLGADLGAAVDDYNIAGFNATQTQGTPVKDGEGFIGYVRFRAIGAGINDAAFRFPQSTPYIFLWGDTYGVPVANPRTTDTQLLNIAN